METIVKRGNKYSVVYNYIDENGETRQKWEPPVPTKKKHKSARMRSNMTVDEGAVQPLGEEDIFFTFPAVVTGKAKTRLVLKKPKTESSIRKVWIPATLAKLLRTWKDSQNKLKEILGDDYFDYNLVIALENGRPCEDRGIGNAFNRLKRKADRPDGFFNSLRHSSTTYKLKLNKGDIKFNHL